MNNKIKIALGIVVVGLAMFAYKKFFDKKNAEKTPIATDSE